MQYYYWFGILFYHIQLSKQSSKDQEFIAHLQSGGRQGGRNIKVLENGKRKIDVRRNVEKYIDSDVTKNSLKTLHMFTSDQVIINRGNIFKEIKNNFKNF